MPFGAGLEEIQFADGAVNAKQAGRCFPFGQAQAVGQMSLINLAASLNISIWDLEIRQNVLTEEQQGSFVGQKLRSAYKSFAALKRNAEIQLISDVIDGTRSITSTDQSDGNGNSVTYSPTITGYAGQIEDTGIVMPALTQGTLPAFASAGDVMDLCKTLQDRAAEMMEEDTAYSKLGVNTFCLQRPLLIMETRVLNAMDNAWALDGAAKQIPTRTAREYLRMFSEIVEIPAFAELPTNASYNDKRLGAVLLDRDSLGEDIFYENMESARCVEQRMTGYNYMYISAMHVYRGNPACGVLFDTQ